jgi:hypothetical protein
MRHDIVCVILNNYNANVGLISNRPKKKYCFMQQKKNSLLNNLFIIKYLN